MTRESFLATYFREAPTSFHSRFEEVTVSKRLRAGNLLALEGDRPAFLPVVLRGAVRVYKASETGREVTLYRIEPGECCILTASCLLSGRPFRAAAEAEENGELVMIPRGEFLDWMDRYEFWRRYVFDLLARRLDVILATVEEVAFGKLDRRIGRFLLEHAAEGRHELHMTHSDIARELGTAREVVSRILKDFEREGCIQMARRTIVLRDPDVLRSRLLEM